MTRRCSKTGKVRFRTEIDAMLALSRRAHNDKGETRNYRCPFCNGWHLTSQPPATKRRT